ncbi:hypothetical protein AAE478_005059 [Parahypoxylon ruwenzoriense]
MANISARWIPLASNARLRRSSHCVSVLENQAWIFGGELVPRQPVDNQFDVVGLGISEGMAASRPNMFYEGFASATLPAPSEAPSPRVGSTTAALKDALYLFSGRGGLAMMPIEEHGALWRYTPTQSLWNLIKPADPSAPYPAGRSYHTMASDGNTKLYVHAGCPENGRLSDLWSFDVESNTWTKLPAAPPPARGGTSITLSGGKLYRMNGFDGKSEQGGSIDVYDISTRAWSTIPFQPDGIHGPEPRSVSALISVNIHGSDHLLTLFGERDPSSLGHAGAGKMLADGWAFNLERKEWSKIETEGEAPAARGWFDADVVQDQTGKSVVVVHGGLAEDNSRLGDAWKLQFI